MATQHPALAHEQLHGVRGRAEQGRVPIPHTLHGRALKHKVPFIMNSMQIAPLAQALGPGDPCAPAISGSPSWNAAMYACSER